MSNQSKLSAKWFRKQEGVSDVIYDMLNIDKPQIDIDALLNKFFNQKLESVSEEDIKELAHEMNDTYTKETGLRPLQNSQLIFAFKFALTYLKKDQ